MIPWILSKLFWYHVSGWLWTIMWLLSRTFTLVFCALSISVMFSFIDTSWLNSSLPYIQAYFVIRPLIQICWSFIGCFNIGVALMVTLIARFMGPTWGPSGADRTQVGPMLAPWTLLSGKSSLVHCGWLVFYLYVPLLSTETRKRHRIKANGYKTEQN